MNKILIIFLFISNLIIAQNEEVMKGVVEYQQTLNKKFKTKGKSPLREKDRVNFKSLDFFKIDLKYRVEATYSRIDNTKMIMVSSSSGKNKFLLPYAKVNFEIENKKHELTLYKSASLMNNPAYDDYLMLPFTDLTNGISSYGAGRFIDLTIPKGDTIIIDFNQAYNPYCAYSDGWNCTIPPKENHLNIEIKAGVKKYKKH